MKTQHSIENKFLSSNSRGRKNNQNKKSKSFNFRSTNLEKDSTGIRFKFVFPFQRVNTQSSSDLSRSMGKHFMYRRKRRLVTAIKLTLARNIDKLAKKKKRTLVKFYLPTDSIRFHFGHNSKSVREFDFI